MRKSPFASNIVVVLDPEHARKLARVALENGQYSTPWLRERVAALVDAEWVRLGLGPSPLAVEPSGATAPTDEASPEDLTPAGEEAEAEAEAEW